jgi:hypothetical protein
MVARTIAAALCLWLVNFPLDLRAAEQTCNPTRAQILSRLTAIADESLAFRGVNNRGQMVEVLTGPDGTWSVVVTIPGGCSVMTTWGTAWQPILPPPVGDPS